VCGGGRARGDGGTSPARESGQRRSARARPCGSCPRAAVVPLDVRSAGGLRGRAPPRSASIASTKRVPAAHPRAFCNLVEDPLRIGALVAPHAWCEPGFLATKARPDGPRNGSSSGVRARPRVSCISARAPYRRGQGRPAAGRRGGWRFCVRALHDRDRAGSRTATLWPVLGEQLGDLPLAETRRGGARPAPRERGRSQDSRRGKGDVLLPEGRAGAATPRSGGRPGATPPPTMAEVKEVESSRPNQSRFPRMRIGVEKKPSVRI